jgi:hypothetical protein
MLGYELFRKQYFYTKKAFRLQYEFTWKKTSSGQHIFAPLSFTYISSSNVSDSFSKQAVAIPGLKTNLYNEIILGSFYSYTFNTANPFAKRQWFINAGIDVAGNIAGLLSGADQPRKQLLFNTPYAQYVKADIDLRYQVTLPNKMDWVNRLLVGIGIPYNNSNMLPFSKQYVIGGSGSTRGFAMRKLGPGSYLPDRYDQVYNLLIGGDYKLQFNSELRIPLVAKLSGAVFLDAGNIWTKDTLLFGKAGQLKKDFYKELSVASGFGLRFDAGLILLRVDLGIPLRKPYLPEGRRWVVDKIALGDAGWRQQNLVLNIALGYPF